MLLWIQDGLELVVVLQIHLPGGSVHSSEVRVDDRLPPSESLRWLRISLDGIVDVNFVLALLLYYLQGFLDFFLALMIYFAIVLEPRD